MNKILSMEVITPAMVYHFKAEVHTSNRPEDQKIEPSFYEANGGQIPQGIHHEMELIESPAFRRLNPEVPIHVHVVPDTGKHFVCFTGQLSTMDQAESLFRVWCAGTVYSIEHDEDFGPLAGEHPNGFLSFLANEYGIKCTN